MKRRRFLALGGGVVTGGAFVGYTQSERITATIHSVLGDELEHEISIQNNRETGHDVRIVGEFDTDYAEFGPYILAPDETRELTRVTSYDEATLELYVDERQVWRDTHGIPAPDVRGRLSMFVISLDPENEITSDHWIED